MNFSASVLETRPGGLTLSWHDYLIFAIMLAISTSIGLYYGCLGTKQKTVDEYLLGNKKMSALPIALSVAVGHFTAITLMGMTADVYKYGAFQIFACISMFLIVAISVTVYLPVFFNLQITNAYEYLERRFDKKTKLLASSLYVLCEIIYLGLVAYTPSLALSVATGFKVYLISITICAICVFYTTIGGLKAVVWTDFFQLFIIVATLLVVCIIGFNSSGFLFVWEKAVEGERFNIWDFNIDPTRRDSFWIFLIGYTAHFVNFLILNQSGLQKFLALPSFRECVRSTFYVALSLCLINIFVVLIGVLMYARYAHCDPLTSKKIQKHEQIVPYYIMDVAGHIPGVSGCFLVALFCAALSTISSSLSALSGVIYKDFIYKYLKNKKETYNTKILKLIVAVCGIICICLSLVIGHLGDVVPLGASIVSMAQGPSMGMFTLGVLFPKANANGAFYGALGGFIFAAIMALPLKLYHYKYKMAFASKPLSVDGCLISNKTVEWLEVPNIYNNISSSDSGLNLQPPSIFRISHFYQTLFGAIFTVVLGIIVSYATRKKDYEADKILLSPLGQKLLGKKKQSEEMKDLLKQKL